MDRLHITLARLGDATQIDAAEMTAISRSAATLARPAFRVNFDRIEHDALSGTQPMRGAIAFQRHLVQALYEHGVAFDRGFRFRPHISLAYRRAVTSCRAIDAIGWRVDEFLLVESIHGKGRHLEHGRWRLS